MKVALVGNQNCGKTTLFNLLTGMNQKIGNWPGVTLERKSGIIKGTSHEVTDLPGIYSLNPYTIEEEVSRNFLIKSEYDLVVNIIDATSLQRGLYLTTQLMDLNVKVIVVLNMIDRLYSKGIEIDIKKLSDYLGVEVCMISALKGDGIDELIKKICKSSTMKMNRTHILSSEVEEILLSLENRIIGPKEKRYTAIESLCYGNSESIKIIRNRFESKHRMELYEAIITMRYEYIDNVCKECICIKKVRYNVSRALDKIFLNKFLAIPIFAFVMFLMYFFSVGIIGKNTVNFINYFFECFKEVIQNLLASIGVSNWIVSLICDGIVSGVGSILSFLPQLTILFICISILESTGYMSRIAFLLDKFFRKIGLSGKALIPFIIGTGCSVPGIMSSKILEDEYDRKVSCVLTPFVPCSAKLPIIALFTSYFFRDNYSLIATSFYFLSAIIVIVSSLIIKKVFKRSKESSYISELPEYKMPSVKYVFKDVLDKIKEFVRKAGTIIFLSSVMVWILLSFSMKFEYGADIENSILAFVGKKISWIFYPVIGVNSWQVCVSTLQGLIAKEQVVSSLEIIAGLSGEVKNAAEIFGTGSPFMFFTKASGYAFVIFNLFSVPCFASVATMKNQLKNFKQILFVILFQILLAFGSSSLIFNVLSLLEMRV